VSQLDNLIWINTKSIFFITKTMIYWKTHTRLRVAERIIATDGIGIQCRLIKKFINTTVILNWHNHCQRTVKKAEHPIRRAHNKNKTSHVLSIVSFKPTGKMEEELKQLRRNKLCCCILRGPGGERIVDVVPGGTGLEPQVKTGCSAGCTRSQ
jgi:hypothetical protein